MHLKWNEPPLLPGAVLHHLLADVLISIPLAVVGWVGLGDWLHTETVSPSEVTHCCTNWT